MASQKSRLLKSHYYNYNAEFRRIRKDKGRKRSKRYIAKRLVTKALGTYGDELAIGAGALLVSRLLKGRQTIGQATVTPESTSEKINVGLQYLKEGASLGSSPAVDSIGGRLNLIGQRVQRGINTYQDVRRLPTRKRTKVLAGIGIAQQVSADVWRDLTSPVTLRKRN